MPPWMLAAALHGANAGLQVEGDGVATLPQGGARRPIGRATEGLQLHWVLHCGAHLRLATPKAIHSPAALRCKFCDRADPAVPPGPHNPSDPEARMFAALCVRGLAAALRPEVRVPGWHGRVDLMLWPTQVLVQTDGPQHCTGRMHASPASAQMGADGACCVSMWRRGRVLVRVHWADPTPNVGAALVARVHAQAAAGFNGPALILSPTLNTQRLRPPPGAACRPGLLDLVLTLLRPDHILTLPCGSICMSAAPFM